MLVKRVTRIVMRVTRRVERVTRKIGRVDKKGEVAPIMDMHRVRAVEIVALLEFLFCICGSCVLFCS
jgi:hypothetical protein